jgi:hypothetical protein
MKAIIEVARSQSGELIRGPERFARMNCEFPAKGRWEFTINHIVGDDSEAVSDVSVTDGSRHDRAVSEENNETVGFDRGPVGI